MTNSKTNQKKRLKPEKFFFWTVLIFGILSTFMTTPFSTGDEGYHIYYAYQQFSSKHPETMTKEKLRDIENQSIGATTGGKVELSVKKLITEKVDLKNDGFTLNFISNGNSFAPIDIMHIPAAIGVLIARFIYPSLGVMDYAARLINLLFFVISFYFIIKKSKQGKWLLVMLFSVPYLLKIASPSYDIFSFIVFALFSLNFLDLLNLRSVKEMTKNQKIYTLVTILLLFFAKKNYVFSLFSLLALPMIYTPVSKWYKYLNKKLKAILYTVLVAFVVGAIYFFNVKFGLIHFSKVFFNSYLNFATMGSNARRMWMIVPASLPDFINILWIIGLIIVIAGEVKRKYSKTTIILSSFTYLINWVGIFAAVYISLSREVSAFDDLSGRYLQPFIIFFVPLIRNFAYRTKIQISEQTVENIAKYYTIVILGLYLFITFYRGFVLRVKPTGVV